MGIGSYLYSDFYKNPWGLMCADAGTRADGSTAIGRGVLLYFVGRLAFLSGGGSALLQCIGANLLLRTCLGFLRT